MKPKTGPVSGDNERQIGGPFSRHGGRTFVNWRRTGRGFAARIMRRIARPVTLISRSLPLPLATRLPLPRVTERLDYAGPTWASHVLRIVEPIRFVRHIHHSILRESSEAWAARQMTWKARARRRTLVPQHTLPPLDDEAAEVDEAQAYLDYDWEPSVTEQGFPVPGGYEDRLDALKRPAPSAGRERVVDKGARAAPGGKEAAYSPVPRPRLGAPASVFARAQQSVNWATRVVQRSAAPLLSGETARKDVTAGSRGMVWRLSPAVETQPGMPAVPDAAGRPGFPDFIEPATLLPGEGSAGKSLVERIIDLETWPRPARHETATESTTPIHQRVPRLIVDSTSKEIFAEGPDLVWRSSPVAEARPGMPAFPGEAGPHGIPGYEETEAPPPERETAGKTLVQRIMDLETWPPPAGLDMPLAIKETIQRVIDRGVLPEVAGARSETALNLAAARYIPLSRPGLQAVQDIAAASTGQAAVVGGVANRLIAREESIPSWLVPGEGEREVSSDQVLVAARPTLGSVIAASVDRLRASDRTREHSTHAAEMLTLAVASTDRGRGGRAPVRIALADGDRTQAPGGPAMQASEAPAEEGEDHAEVSGPAGPDLDVLARTVYAIIKRRLAVERERVASPI